MIAPDPTLGRDAEQWLLLLDSRADRLMRLVKLKAPPVIVSGAIRLIRAALEAIDALAGDPAADAAMIEQRDGPEESSK